MEKLKLFALLSFFMIGTCVNAQTMLIDYGSTWAYYDNGNTPPDSNGLDWNDINFDASAWNTGTAQLGFGDGDESTTLNSSVNAAYFRYSFDVPDPDSFDELDLELIFDDAAVVYLNGTEIWRVNFPPGPITYSSFAAGQSQENELTTNTFNNNLIVTGDNVIAVEIHQHSATSTDISFDLYAFGAVTAKR
ncbi:MAG: hypothetical protein AAGA77_08520 [Bacteroidota bacterium]